MICLIGYNPVPDNRYGVFVCIILTKIKTDVKFRHCVCKWSAFNTLFRIPFFDPAVSAYEIHPWVLNAGLFGAQFYCNQILSNIYGTGVIFCNLVPYDRSAMRFHFGRHLIFFQRVMETIIYPPHRTGHRDQVK